MIGRRRFLRLASFGLASGSVAPADLFAQDPRPKGKARAKPASGDAPALEADEQVVRILGQARTDGRRLPGMIGGIVRGEKLASVGAVGIRKIGSPEPMRVDDLVHLGSCTKAMTATMIGTLVDEGKLRWESTVAEVFPDWARGMHPGYAAVTLDQLVRHRAGLPHDLAWWEGGRGVSVVEARRGLMASALRVAPESKPGATYSYSNTGYVLAGMMAEQVTRTSWEDLMKRRVFGPLAMVSAGFGPPGTRGKVDHAWGHRATGDLVEAVHDDNPPVMGPAGTVHCSLVDWARFASFHLRGELGGVRLLKPETLKVLHTAKGDEEYAGGWLICDRSWAGGTALSHTGSNTYWYCSIWLAPARDFAVLAVVNAAGKPAEDACDQAVSGLVRYANPNDRPPRRR
jgi:CubicO group peptidase (beta-lactamase class C family)